MQAVCVRWLRKEWKQLWKVRGLHKDLLSRGRVPVVRQGTGHRRRGRAGERGGAQGTTHYSPCTVSFLLAAARRSGGSVLWNPHWVSSPRREWQKINPWCFFVIISAWSHVPLSQVEHWSAMVQGRSAVLLSMTPRLGKITSFLLAIQVMGTTVP